MSLRLLRRARDVTAVEVIRGRVLCVDAVLPEGALCFLSEYVDPSWMRADLRGAFGLIREVTTDQSVLSFVGGDFNSIVASEVKFGGAEAQLCLAMGWRETSRAARWRTCLSFSNCAGHFGGFSGSALDVASWIDRIYTSLPSAVMCLLSGSCVVQGDLLERKAASGHLPVVLRLSRRRDRDPRVPPPVDRHQRGCAHHASEGHAG